MHILSAIGTEDCTGTLCKNLGNGSFADFLATISVNFIESGCRSPKMGQNWGRF